MTHLRRQICTIIACGSALAAIMKTPLVAQNGVPSAAFTLDQVLNYPFPDNLIAAPLGSAIAWTFSEQGARNIYVAEAPAFTARRVTAYLDDEGQELTRAT